MAEFNAVGSSEFFTTNPGRLVRLHTVTTCESWIRVGHANRTHPHCRARSKYTQAGLASASGLSRSVSRFGATGRLPGTTRILWAGVLDCEPRPNLSVSLLMSGESRTYYSECGPRRHRVCVDPNHAQSLFERVDAASVRTPGPTNDHSDADQPLQRRLRPDRPSIQPCRSLLLKSVADWHSAPIINQIRTGARPVKAGNTGFRWHSRHKESVAYEPLLRLLRFLAPMRVD